MGDRRVDDPDNVPLSALVAQRGIKTSYDFADFMSGLMSDLVENRIDTEVAKTACMAGDKLLQVVRLQLQVNKGMEGPVQLSGKAKSTLTAGRDPE